ncbi:MAG TPA: sulfatase-like hydrolase/transferase, partial [Bacteroidales bacterium]|nr:sulfatase-like hydrolase/transferase [Bacteroidales bacterium]
MNQLSFLSFCIAGAHIFSAQISAQKSEAKPNIILILADDMGYSDIGCFGSEIKTPNLDRLAQQGLRMTQFYNASRSCPTRASLLTGLYQHQAGIGDMVSNLGYPSYQGYLNEKCVTIAEVLKMNGYRTYMSGKWHVGSQSEVHPLRRGFDRYFGLIDGAGSYFKPIAYRPNMKPVRWMLDDKDFFPPDTGFYMTDAIGDYALSFIKERDKNEPFFLYMAFTAPHWPLHALPEDIEKYRGKYMMGWDKLREERYNRMLSMGIIDPSVRLSPRDVRVPQWDTLPEATKKMWDLRMAVYAAMIDRMDQNIGKVISYLEKTGEMDNTLIIFLSDNGGCHEST